jgi:zinc D-Ala-D-Ala dipeptidase
LKKIQEDLAKRGLGLKVFDGYRTKSAQKIFWELMPDERYVANPLIGSRHQRGASVDVTLIDQNGELVMPSLFDDFSVKAHRNYMEASEEAICHRAILEAAMASQGFIGLPSEWWHFDDADWKSYPLEDFSFEQLVEQSLRK